MKMISSEELAKGYSSTFRAVEVFSIAAFVALMWHLILQISAALADRSIWAVFAFVTGWLLADFISGLVHWGADTWGSAKFPVLGPTLIRSFREHHVDPMSITRHDFIETNGASCLVCLPVLVAALNLDLSKSGAFFAGVVMASLSFWTLMTNQAHQWAHQGELAKPWVKGLQRLWIVLPAPRHAEHHRAPFVESYCITTGWMNPLLNRVGLFRKLEWIVTRVTGEIPRREDLAITFAARKPANGGAPNAIESARHPQ
ncbi:MAG: fatty acid desaturase family protein [Bdellovibrionales bacterium]|nr:fatty acid desaturase family protein [Bdellovibrionales bacterium]